jgi:hypothetical protein
VGAAGEIPFLEAEVAEHSLDQRDVLRLSAVGRARDGELLVTPTQRVESARGQKREHLKWLGAGAPIGERLRVASCAEELIALSDYGSIYPVF